VYQGSRFEGALAREDISDEEKEEEEEVEKEDKDNAGTGTKEGCSYEDRPEVKKRNLQREHIVVSPSDKGRRSRVVTRQEYIAMTPKVREVVEKDLKTWNPSFTFMVS
jgi:hypothetical protein